MNLLRHASMCFLLLGFAAQGLSAFEMFIHPSPVVAQAGAVEAIATATDGMSWGQIFASVGVTGILIWYLWYTVTVVLPRKEELYTLSIKEIVTQHLTHQNSTLERFEERMATMRNEHREDLRSIQQSFRCHGSTHQNTEK